MISKEGQMPFTSGKSEWDKMESESNGGRKMNVEELDNTRVEGCN